MDDLKLIRDSEKRKDFRFSVPLDDKIEFSINMIKSLESLALYMHLDGFHLAFSGGKDSIVLYHLAKKAKVKFKAHMLVTTIDPPEVMRCVRSYYKDVLMHRPKTNMFQEIKDKKCLPTGFYRWCCRVLKEKIGIGTVTLLGIRALESLRRSERYPIEKSGYPNEPLWWDMYEEKGYLDRYDITTQDKMMVSPLYYWSEADVWNYIRNNNLHYPELYDQGWSRVGCMFCPMSRVGEKKLELQRYPKVAQKFIDSIDFIVKEYGYADKYTDDPVEIFHWWISNKSMKNYFRDKKKNQYNLFEKNTEK